MGIDPNAIERIFEPFYTTKSTGMGMGLSITRSILQRHGGRLCATAPRGRGASFYFTVPRYDEQEEMPKADEAGAIEFLTKPFDE